MFKLYYPIMSLHVNRQLLALRELFWAKGAMEVLDPKVNLFVRFQDVLVKKALATAFKRTFELSFCRVSHNMTLQVILVAAPARARYVGRKQGGTSWLAFGERKIIPQSFRRAGIYKFSRQKHRFFTIA